LRLDANVVHVQAALLISCAGVFLLAGCSSSTTVTREIEDKPTGIVQEENEFKYLAKIKREKAREDDKKVDVNALKREFSDEASHRADTSLAMPDGLNRDDFLLEVVGYLGVRYSYGGSSKKGMDCSGFICKVYKSVTNKLLPRSTSEQFRVGDKIKKNELQFGDLVFFNTTGRSPSHVGIYIEDGIFAHASVVEGVTLSSMESTYYRKRFVGARRVVE
jgi:hypothetical protein